jgi:hypothetical protein
VSDFSNWFVRYGQSGQQQLLDMPGVREDGCFHAGEPAAVKVLVSLYSCQITFVAFVHFNIFVYGISQCFRRAHACARARVCVRVCVCVCVCKCV